LRRAPASTDEDPTDLPQSLRSLIARIETLLEELEEILGSTAEVEPNPPSPTTEIVSVNFEFAVSFYARVAISYEGAAGGTELQSVA
jgi:hypothetical protein